jgi:hypothetical protein
LFPESAARHQANLILRDHANFPMAGIYSFDSSALNVALLAVRISHLTARGGAMRELGRLPDAHA